MKGLEPDLSGDVCGNVESDERSRYLGQRATRVANYQRVLVGPSEALSAFTHILAALDGGVSVAELERALVTIKSHLDYGGQK